MQPDCVLVTSCVAIDTVAWQYYTLRLHNMSANVSKVICSHSHCSHLFTCDSLPLLVTNCRQLCNVAFNIFWTPFNKVLATLKASWCQNCVLSKFLWSLVITCALLCQWPILSQTVCLTQSHFLSCFLFFELRNCSYRGSKIKITYRTKKHLWGAF